MKKETMILGTCLAMGLSSCTWTETVDEIIVQSESCLPEMNCFLAESRTANGLFCRADGDCEFVVIDWNSFFSNPLKEYVDSNDNYVAFFYDGKGGTFIRDSLGVGIRYRQSTDNWLTDRFNFAMSDNLSIQEQDKLVFQDAFANIKLKITNHISNLVLEIKNFKLVNLSREGLFRFPQENGEPLWVNENPDGLAEVLTDTLCVSPGDSLILPANGTLPIIPQKVKAWNPSNYPTGDAGTYLLLGCRISYLNDDTVGGVSVWCGDNGGFAYAAIPISFDVRMGSIYTIEITMETSCPWYSLRNTTPSKILQPITFNPSVDDWIE